MDVSKLKEFFILENNEDLFNQGITPKSCGGGEEFKLLALLGDRVLNLELFEILSSEGIKDSGTITIRINNYFHNEDILTEVGRILHIEKFMKPMDFNHKITKDELKESVEALIGANFKAHGYGIHKEVIKKLYKIIQEIEKNLQKQKQNQLFYENPKGKLLELFQERGLILPLFDTKRVGGTDNLPEFKCKLSGNFNKKEIVIEGDSSNNKKEAEKDAAVKFLMELEGYSEFKSVSKDKEIIIQPNPKPSIDQKEIIFSKRVEDFRPDQINLSSGTETLHEWAKRKSVKKPFSMLTLLAYREEKVTGSSWNTSLPYGKLILSKTTLDGKDYFEVGFAESFTKAKKEAARKLIKNSDLFEWLKNNYGNKPT